MCTDYEIGTEYDRRILLWSVLPWFVFEDSLIGFSGRLVNSPNAIVSWVSYNISSLAFLSWNEKHLMPNFFFFKNNFIGRSYNIPCKYPRSFDELVKIFIQYPHHHKLLTILLWMHCSLLYSPSSDIIIEDKHAADH